MRERRTLDVGHALPLALCEARERPLRDGQLGKLARAPKLLLLHLNLIRLCVERIGAWLRRLVDDTLCEVIDLLKFAIGVGSPSRAAATASSAATAATAATRSRSHAASGLSSLEAATWNQGGVPAGQLARVILPELITN